MVNQCRLCSEIKPNFYKPPNAQLIKATQPFERLSLDFKGPLPSSTKNHHIVTVIDKYSRFPFAFSCANMKACTVIACLNQLFALFEMPNYVHTDRAATFMSQELSSYFQRRGIACSRTTDYNAPGNGQCERFNGNIWSAVRLALKSSKLDIRQWELVLPDALHSIRSPLCTATNQTPHERMFNYKRKSSFGISVPTWPSAPGLVYLKRHVRSSKYEHLVEEVDLVHTAPNYAVVCMPRGRETTVSLRNVAPSNSENDQASNENNCMDNSVEPEVSNDYPPSPTAPKPTIACACENSETSYPADEPRQSSCVRKAVDR